MPPIPSGAHDLLEYNPQYSLLICRECQYAVQKNALESHLLRHKIYRADRQRLLSSISQLALLDPDDVPVPAPGSSPISILPILSGYGCTVADCRHSTASDKRMKRHWSDVHSFGGSIPLLSTFTRSVKLQTFFRGTKVSYFEVALPTTPLLSSDDDYDCDDNHRGNDEEAFNYTTGTPPEPTQPFSAPTPFSPAPTPPNVSPCSQISQDTRPDELDLEALTYFHHFITTTSLTLPSARNTQSAKQYWQMHVVSQALRHPWLMYSLLAISACHLAAFADDTITKETHREREAQFFSKFSAGSWRMTQHDLIFETVKVEEEVKEISDLVRCLLCCAQMALDGPVLATDPCQVQLIMSSIQGCIVPLRSSGMPSHGDEQQQDISVRARRVMQAEVSSEVGDTCTTSPSANTSIVQFDRLQSLPFRIAEIFGRPESSRDVFATMSAISSMIDCFDISIAYDEMDAALQAAATWLANVSDPFNQMVLSLHPIALVVVFHWAEALVRRAGTAYVVLISRFLADKLQLLLPGILIRSRLFRYVLH